MLLSMLCNCVAFVPSETLVLSGCIVLVAGLVLPALTWDDLSPIVPAGSGLLGLSIFTLILSVQMSPIAQAVELDIGNKVEIFRVIMILYNRWLSLAQL
jgi:hypothetical protein